MAKLNRDEILKMAEMSALKLNDAEVTALLSDIQTLIDYTDQLSDAELGREHDTIRNINTLRDDVARTTTDASPLDIAPQRDETYFVVPKIIN